MAALTPRPRLLLAPPPGAALPPIEDPVAGPVAACCQKAQPCSARTLDCRAACRFSQDVDASTNTLRLAPLPPAVSCSKQGRRSAQVRMADEDGRLNCKNLQRLRLPACAAQVACPVTS